MVCSSESVLRVRSNSGPTLGSRAPFTHWSWDDVTRFTRASEIYTNVEKLKCAGWDLFHWLSFITYCLTSEMKHALVQFKHLRLRIRLLVCRKELHCLRRNKVECMHYVELHSALLSFFFFLKAKHEPKIWKYIFVHYNINCFIYLHFRLYLQMFVNLALTSICGSLRAFSLDLGAGNIKNLIINTS